MTNWMTLLETVRLPWRRRVRSSERPASAFPFERPIVRVPAEYMGLHEYLDHRYASTVVLTFEQMEALLGFALPAPASTDRDWWTVAAVPANHYSDAWTRAGRTAMPNLLARTVTFERRP